MSVQQEQENIQWITANQPRLFIWKTDPQNPHYQSKYALPLYIDLTVDEEEEEEQEEQEEESDEESDTENDHKRPIVDLSADLSDDNDDCEFFDEEYDRELWEIEERNSKRAKFVWTCIFIYSLMIN